jgi:hypothetical protein
MRLIALSILLSTSALAAPALTSKILNMRLPGHFGRIESPLDGQINKFIDNYIKVGWQERCVAHEHLYWPISNKQVKPFDVYQNLLDFVSPYWHYEEEKTVEKSATGILQPRGNNTLSVYVAAIFKRPDQLDVFLCQTSTAITGRQ